MNTSRPPSQGLPAQQGHVKPAAHSNMPQGGRSEVNHVHHPHAPAGPIKYTQTAGMPQHGGPRMTGLPVDPQRAQLLYQQIHQQQQQQDNDDKPQVEGSYYLTTSTYPYTAQPIPINIRHTQNYLVRGPRHVNPNQQMVNPRMTMSQSRQPFSPYQYTPVSGHMSNHMTQRITNPQVVQQQQPYLQPRHPTPGYNIQHYPQSFQAQQYGNQHFVNHHGPQYHGNQPQFQPQVQSQGPNATAGAFIPQNYQDAIQQQQQQQAAQQQQQQQVQPQQLVAQQQQLQPQQPYTKRPSRAIQIKDPSTGKALDMTGEAKKAAEKQPEGAQSRSRLTPQPEPTPRSRQASESARAQSEPAPVEPLKVEPLTVEVVAEPVKPVEPTVPIPAGLSPAEPTTEKETPLKPVATEQPAEAIEDDGSWNVVKDPRKEKNEKRKPVQKQNERNSKGKKEAKKIERQPSKEETPIVSSEPVKVEPVVVNELECNEESVGVPEPVAPEPVAPEPVVEHTPEPPRDPTPEPPVHEPTAHHVEEPVEAIVEATVEPTEPDPVVEEPVKVAEQTEAVLENGETKEAAKPTEDAADEAVAENDVEAATPEPSAVESFGCIAAENRTKLENGEKVAYERDFLLKFQGLCLLKPRELPTLDVILDGPTDGHRKPPKHESVGKGSWTPKYIGQTGHKRRDHANRRDTKPNVIKLPTTRPALHTCTTDNKYIPGSGDTLVRMAKSILNKITPEKEAKLTKEFIQNIKPESFERLEKIVSAVFSKAIEEQHFAKIYAKLCKNCHENWDKDDKLAFYTREDGTNVSIIRREARGKQIKVKGFREVLLSKAQEQFNKLKNLNSKDKEKFAEGSLERRRLEVDDKRNALPAADSPDFNKRTKMELDEEYEELNTRIKIQGLGNVKFVGELYMEGLLSLNIIKVCCQQLVYSDSENELESLCKLIPTIGKRMATGPVVPSRAAVGAQTQADADKKKGLEILDIVFGKIEKIVKDEKSLGPGSYEISPRVVCLLQDVIDIRSRNWEMRSTATKGPSRIGDLHDDDRKRQEEDQRRVQREYEKQLNDRSRQNKERRNQISQGDWVKQSHISKSKFDATQLASKPTMDRGNPAQITLGPRRRGQNFKNSSMDKNSNDNSASSSGRGTPVPSNMFDLLDADVPDRPTRPGKTTSNSYGRKGSLAGQGRSNQKQNFGRHQTHDGRVEKRRMTPEEVNLILPEIKKKAGTLFSDLDEAQGDMKIIIDVARDHADIFDSVEAQTIIMDVLLEKVIEKNDKDRVSLSKLLMVVADVAKLMEWETCLSAFVKKAVDEDRITDCPKFWSYFGQCISRIYTSPAVDPKSIKGITEPAKELCQWSKAIITLIEEIDYVLHSKEKIHEFYTNAEVDIGAILAADESQDDPKDRLKRRGLGFLLEPLVVVKWGEVENKLIGSLEDHEFGELETENFSAEFDMLESFVPEGPDGRSNRKFYRLIINAVMNYSVGSNNELVVRNESGDVKDTNFSDCEVLMRKYLDNVDAQMETLFTLSDIFRKHENNATLIKQVFSELYELSIMEIPTFVEWITLKSACRLENFPVISAATKSFYVALEEEKKLQSKSPSEA